MVQLINNWCENIIICVIVITIINLLNNENNRYIKVVEGIFIMFVIVSPVFGIIKNIDNFKTIFDFDKDEILSSTNEINLNTNDKVKKMYLENMDDSIKEDLISKGYSNVKKINVYYDKDYKNIEKIIIILENKDVLTKTNRVNIKVNISINDNNIISDSGEEEDEYFKNENKNIIDFLINNYNIDENKIILQN